MFRIEEQEKRCQSKAVDDSKGSPDRGTCRKDILSCKTVSKEGKSVSHVAVIRPSVCKPQSARQEAIIPLKDILLLSIWLPVISILPLRIRCDTLSWTEYSKADWQNGICRCRIYIVQHQAKLDCAWCWGSIAWGWLLSTTGSLAVTFGAEWPFRYRAIVCAANLRICGRRNGPVISAKRLLQPRGWPLHLRRRHSFHRSGCSGA